MVILKVRGGFHFDQPPATVTAALQDVHADKDAAVLKHPFEDRWNFPISDQLSGGSDCLFESPVAGDFNTARKKLPC
jgi:hypothetical protein